LFDHLPQIKLIIVGDGPAREYLAKTFSGTDTHFTGYLKGEGLAKAFASSDLFVMPSTTETLGFVTLEAMSSGLTVVAADAGGTKDLIEHGRTGYLYDPEKPMQMVDHVKHLLESPVRRRQMAGRSRLKAETCTWSEETRKLKRSYLRAIEIHNQALNTSSLPVSAALSLPKAIRMGVRTRFAL
jgi:glycosyltransferase involved in cell wall biosynthesis